MEVGFPKGFIVEDEQYPKMYRLHLPGGEMSDLYNETRIVEFLRDWEDIKIGYEDISL